MSRLILWWAARLVPRDRRADWLEHWRAELWTLQADRTPISALRFSLGAWPDALAECAAGCREGWSFGGLSADIRDAYRVARRQPGATLLAVLVLGCGATATATIFSLADAVLLRPLPWLQEPDRLVQIGRHDASRFDNFSFPNFTDLASAVEPAMVVAGYTNRSVIVGGGLEARAVPAQGVTANFFSLLGVPVHAGPGFDRDDTTAFLTSRVAIVSDRLWRDQGEAIRRNGQTLLVNGQPHAVVGVAPPGFTGATTVGRPPDLWLPLGGVRRDADGEAWIDARGHSWIFAIGRLQPTVTFEAATAALERAHANLAASHGPTIGTVVTMERGLGLRPLERIEARQIVGLLFAVATLVLLVAAANVSGLQFARALMRRHELAVRAALGAGRRRLWRALLVEQALLAAAAALVAVVLSVWTTAWLREALPYALTVGVGPDLRVFAFAVIASVGASTGVALWPLRHVVAGSAVDTMRVRHPDAALARTGRALVIIEVAVSSALLGGGVLLVRSSLAAARADTGFATDALVLTLGAQPNRNATARIPDLLRALASVPGVATVAAADTVPIVEENARAFLPPGTSVEAGDRPLRVISTQVTPGYFDVLSVRSISGRLIEDDDHVGTETPAVVNRAFASAFWPAQEAVGETWTAGPVVYRVVGVIDDFALREIGERGAPGMWTPIDPGDGLPSRWLIRSSSGADVGAATLRDALEPFRQDVLISRVEPLSVLLGESLAMLTLLTELLVAVALAALVMAALGLHSVSALHVSRQRRAIGIQLALGAAPAAVVASILRTAVATAAVGAGLGLAATVVLAGSLQHLLFGVRPGDPIALTAAALSMAAVSVLSAIGPARRAAHIDPCAAMRAE